MQSVNVSFTAQLRELGVVGNKHIAPGYLRAGNDQRIDLLRGLMDTDGWWNVTRRRAGFTTTDDRLAADVIELLRSLGIHPLHFAKPYVNTVRPSRTWHVIEFTPTGFNPFSLPRKAAALVGDLVTAQDRTGSPDLLTAGVADLALRPRAPPGFDRRRRSLRRPR